MTTTNRAPERQEIELMLPWHAAGTLNRRDAQRVENAIENDPELARQYALVREEFSETIHLNETLGAPSARAMEKLFAGIEAESGPARQVQQSFSFSSWVSEKLSALTPRTLAYSATAAALVVALQFGLLTGVVMNNYGPGGRVEMASGPSDRTNGSGSYALVTFAPNASIADINAFLDKNELKVTDGPRGPGIYRVQISKSPLDKSKTDEVIQRLRQGGGVVLSVLPEGQ
jgi:hypothetical protein